MRAVVVVDHLGVATVPDDLRSSRFLAMTPGASLSLDARGIRHETFEDVYPAAEFRRDALALNADVEGLLRELDARYAPSLGVRRPFTGQAYWFEGFFANLHYLSILARRLREQGDVVFLADRSYQAMRSPDARLSLAPVSLRFYAYINALGVKVALLADAVRPEWRALDTRWAPIAPPPNAFDVQRQIGKLRRAPAWLRARIRRRAKEATVPSGDRVLVVQDGFEIDLLRAHAPDLSFVRPLDGIVAALREEHRLADVPGYPDALEKFLLGRFPELAHVARRLFASYRADVLPYVPAFRERFERSVRDAQPRAALFSVGPHTVFEHAAADVLEAQQVPMIFFEHGGAMSYLRDPYYQRHLEENPDVPHLNVFYSAARRDALRERFPGPALGSIKLHAIAQRSRPSASSRAIYLPGYLNFENYKDILFNAPDRDLLPYRRALLEATARHGVPLDVKVHSGGATDTRPNAEEYNFHYFRALAKAVGPGARVLAGYPAEQIVPRYGLLVLDYLGTAMLPVAAATEAHVLLIVPDGSLLTPYAREDLGMRFHVATRPEEVAPIIEAFGTGRLERRRDPRFVDRYLYPAGTDPGEAIARFVRRPRG